MQLPAKGHMGSDAVVTGGGAKTVLAARGVVKTSAKVDAYRYRNFEAKGRMCTCVEVRDSQGRLKWAEDECGNCEIPGMS